MITASILIFLAAFFRGLAELLVFHHGKSIFSGRVHPLSFFGARSDLRKYRYSKEQIAAAYHAPETWYYKTFDIRYKERFPLSATVFVFLTDGFHFSSFLSKVLIVCALIFSPLGTEHTWQMAVVLALYYSTAWALGFFLSYNLIFQKR
jgi:hypothetical protein